MRKFLSILAAVLKSLVEVVVWIGGLPVRVLRALSPVPPAPPEAEDDEETRAIKAVSEAQAVRRVACDLLAGDAPRREFIRRLSPETSAWLLDLTRADLERVKLTPTPLLSGHLSGRQHVNGLRSVLQLTRTEREAVREVVPGVLAKAANFRMVG